MITFQYRCKRKKCISIFFLFSKIEILNTHQTNKITFINKITIFIHYINSFNIRAIILHAVYSTINPHHIYGITQYINIKITEKRQQQTLILLINIIYLF